MRSSFFLNKNNLLNIIPIMNDLFFSFFIKINIIFE